MKKTELLIMAAGMGSRFGGFKQIEPIGPNGECILDFSVYDAKKAGFDKVTIVIKKEIEKDFRAVCGKRIEKMIDTDYVFQEATNLPSGFCVPSNRSKPWGTGHAVLCAKDVIKSPFAVINADDYYGYGAYHAVHKHLTEKENMCMVGYILKNTITENGTVARGICEIENDTLKSIKEHTAIDKSCGIPLDTIVSMNMWGFDVGIFEYLEEKFKSFLGMINDAEKDEFYLPSAIASRISEQGKTVTVLKTEEKWYGVTYKEDTMVVKKAMADFVGKGLYRFAEERNGAY